MSRLPLTYLHSLRNRLMTPEEVITKGCLNPKMLSLKSSADGKYRSQFVDCGKCYNCRKERRDEWSSRMALHSLYWKHCYFVTLTYGSYDLTKFEKHPFLADWQETCPHVDSFNYSHTVKVTPSILVHSHCQKFLKRLRLLHDSPISFAATGEYGGDYGRPHFHIILWSNTPIPQSEIYAAWSIMCVRTDNPRVVLAYRRKDTPSERVFRFRIGRIKIDDLVENGSLDWNAQMPVKDKNGTHCFTYVAKYINKDISFPAPTAMRVRWAFSLLPTSEHDSMSDDGSDNKYYKQFILNSKIYEKCSYSEFQRAVAPFFRSSRLYSLGKQYYLENRNRFKTGNFALPKFCGKELVFPHFFYRLLDEDQNPLRLDKIVFSGHSLSKGVYPSLVRWFEELRDNRSNLANIYRYLKVKTPLPQQRELLFLTPDEVGFEDFISDPAKNGSIFYIKLLRNTAPPLYVRYSWYYDMFEYYEFHRDTQSYDFVQYDERVDFCDWIIRILKQNMRSYQLKKLILDSKLQLDLLVQGKFTGDSVNLQSEDDLSLYDRLHAAVNDYVEKRASNSHHYQVSHETKDNQ